MAFKTEWIETHYPHLFEQLRMQLVKHWAQSAQFTEKLANGWYDQVLEAAQRPTAKATAAKAPDHPMGGRVTGPLKAATLPSTTHHLPHH